MEFEVLFQLHLPIWTCNCRTSRARMAKIILCSSVKMDQENQTKVNIGTDVNVNARICLPEGSLSRSVGRALSLASIGRYGIRTWKFNKEKALQIYIEIKSRHAWPPMSTQGTHFTLFKTAAGASFSDDSIALASILIGASLPSSTTSSLLMLIPWNAI